MQPLPDILYEACHQYVAVLLSPVSTSSQTFCMKLATSMSRCCCLQLAPAAATSHLPSYCRISGKPCQHSLNLANYKLLKTSSDCYIRSLSSFFTDSKTLPHKNTQKVITVPIGPKEVHVSGLMCYMDCLSTIIYIHLQKSEHYRQGCSWGEGGGGGCPGKQNLRGSNMAEKQIF